ncbi:uncharacterized protein TNCV_4901251 [Trichonephila clavipes]|nr:uncharacterized protein TNCV_4901251 [Trichonephila clavipes]
MNKYMIPFVDPTEYVVVCDETDNNSANPRTLVVENHHINPPEEPELMVNVNYDGPKKPVIVFDVKPLPKTTQFPIIPSREALRILQWNAGHLSQSKRAELERHCIIYNSKGKKEKETPNSTTVSFKIAQGNSTASCKRLISWFLLDKVTELGHKIVPVRPPKF